MASSDPPPNAPKWYDEALEWCRLLLILLYCFLLFAILGFVPMVASKAAPWTGFVLSVLALPAWCYLGPPSGPGLLQGQLAVGPFIWLLMLALYAFCRAMYWTFAG